MRPVAQAYTDHVPELVQTGIHNVVQNLKEPAVALNDLLQGNVKHAWEAAQRLAVNTTVGAAGIVDVASKWGLPPHKADFGQTLAVWGVGEGPFVELPLLGPSNPRDAVGTAVDLALNPLTFVGGAPATVAGAATSGANMVDTRAQHLQDLDELERNSLDYYATLRSVYRQHREAEISAAKQRETQGRVDISFPNATLARTAPGRQQQMSVAAKICGLSTEAAVAAAIAGGAAYLGFVFYPPSPRAVTPARAARLCAAVPSGIARVGLFVDADDDAISAVLAEAPIDILQFHGRESPERVADVKVRFAGR